MPVFVSTQLSRARARVRNSGGEGTGEHERISVDLF
jgi:hypothetical protein